MNSLVVLSVVFAAINVAQAELDKAEALELLEKCQKILGSEENVEAMIDEKRIPTTEKGKCLLACMAEEKGFIDKEGKVNHDAISKFMEKKFGDDKEKLEKAAKIIALCNTTVDTSKMEKCEAVNEFTKCAKEKKETL